ncbi:calcium/sodium antiporter [Psychroserpens sp.]|uniref:calcium/sodium antiporter n=1 Tax=Psychroserpens sp. TaxID=2020870 RepID=UPI001B2DBD37|nr:calcium/sodium antiporter [Psychroserpens sp.]MBO6607627.1 calcium/sodium antiporter [Psychroserpens sp.]MBO6631441.1 calcium/sodium antiporter [Psychroserpens sp.]MBO6655061.1 calcium/sodium antiporter [Psychroserpens sp.]MBO6683134.1 calcium/sodium antiporter [Psychroserpens sp.]MBO6749687.1 calcium/sodium antiporter [Psychroserpens sp.]
MSVVWIILGLFLLVMGGEFLVRSSVALSFKFDISKMVIGMTVVSFATSAPELLVSLNAALTESPAIAINNVIGSNIANIGLVLGITALLGAIAVDKSFYKLNWPVMMLFSIALFYFLSNDNMLSRIEGLILFAFLIVFLIVLIKAAKKEHIPEEVNEALALVSNFKIVMWLIIGALALYFGSEWLVNGAKDLAETLGVSDAVIAATVIAIGTSVPELAASLIAALKKEKALSLGNLIGSNIFNIGSVLGLTSIIKSIPVTEASILSRDIFWMLAFAAILIPLILLPVRLRISRIKGFVLVSGYVIFIIMSFYK